MEFLLGLIVLALDIWAVINIIGSNRTILPKVLWTLLIVILPVLGFVIWLIAGPRRAATTATL
jgi:Phospholipase_D-nuclease N-terminal